MRKMLNSRGMAMFVVMGFIMLMSIAGMYVLRNTMTESRQLYFANETQKAQYLAEAAMEKATLNIREHMNDFPVDSLKNIGDIDSNPWFWFFRTPGVFAEGGLTKGVGFSEGFGVRMDLQLSGRLPRIVYNATDMGLDSLVAQLTGSRGLAEVEVEAFIEDVYGITPDKPMFDIPGISIPDIPIASEVVNFIQSGELPPIELPIPDFDFGDINITVTVYGIPIDIPVGKFFPSSMKVNIKSLLNSAGVPTQISLGNIAINAIEEILPSEIITPDINNTTGGVAIEKFGNVRFIVNSRYLPNKRDADNEDAWIEHRIIASKEFKVADIAGPSPLYTLFVENTANKRINLNGGDGHLYLNNISFDKLGLGNESDLYRLAEVVNFPGLIRINGTRDMDAKLNFIGPLKGWDFLAATEWTHLFLSGRSDDYNKGVGLTGLSWNSRFSQASTFIPRIPSLIWGVGEWGHWQWPAFGTGNSAYTIPWIDSDAKSHLFGDFGIKPTWTREIEGRVKKNWRSWRACIFRIYIPFWGIDIPVPMWFTRWQDSRTDELSRYAFRNKGSGVFAPHNDYSDIKRRTRPGDDNRAANVYDLSQYGKKAAYFYASSAEFNRDVERRTSMSHDGYFNLDGVNFINSSVELPPMRVKGMGMIVAAGDIIVQGDFLQKGGMGTGRYSTVMGTKAVLKAPKGAFRIEGGHQVDASIYAAKGLYTSSGSSVINGNFACDEFDKKNINGDVRINYMASKTRPDILSMIPHVGKYSPRRYYVSLSDQFSSFRYVRGSDDR